MLQDEKIISAIKSGNNSSVFEELYNLVFPDIGNFIRANSGNQAQAEDCFQDALVSLIMAIRTGRFKSEYSVANYLFIAARNRWYTLVRRTLSHETQLGEVDVKVVEKNPLLEAEKKNMFDQALAAIGDKCRELMRLVLFEKKSHKEIETIMSFSSVDVVKTYNYRCKKKLKEVIKNNQQLKQVLIG